MWKLSLATEFRAAARQPGVTEMPRASELLRRAAYDCTLLGRDVMGRLGVSLLIVSAEWTGEGQRLRLLAGGAGQQQPLAEVPMAARADLRVALSRLKLAARPIMDELRRRYAAGEEASRLGIRFDGERWTFSPDLPCGSTTKPVPSNGLMARWMAIPAVSTRKAQRDAELLRTLLDQRHADAHGMAAAAGAQPSVEIAAKAAAAPRCISKALRIGSGGSRERRSFVVSVPTRRARTRSAA